MLCSLSGVKSHPSVLLMFDPLNHEFQMSMLSQNDIYDSLLFFNMKAAILVDSIFRFLMQIFCLLENI